MALHLALVTQMPHGKGVDMDRAEIIKLIYALEKSVENRAKAEAAFADGIGPWNQVNFTLIEFEKAEMALLHALDFTK
jgi:hypothetical protein